MLYSVKDPHIDSGQTYHDQVIKFETLLDSWLTGLVELATDKRFDLKYKIE